MSPAFSSEQIISTLADGASSVTTADLDDDGDLDVISASTYDDKIAWYINDGSGGFSSLQIISPFAYGATSVTTADLDGDGDLDVLTASIFDNTIAWYENDGSGGFSSKQIISTLADGARSVTTADLDGDTDLDVLSASRYDDTIAWYENNAAPVCFLADTLIATPTGERPIESLQPGDLITTADGVQPLKFLCRTRCHRNTLLALGKAPVRINQGASVSSAPAATPS